jgi:hypothetical protein
VTPGSSSGANKVTANGELLWVPVQEEVVEHLRSHCSLDAVLTVDCPNSVLQITPFPSPLDWISKQSDFFPTELTCGHRPALNPAAIRQMKTAPKVAHELISCGVATVPFPQGCWCPILTKNPYDRFVIWVCLKMLCTPKPNG